MSNDWWALSEEELAEDGAAQTDKTLAYYNTFYSTIEGRQVLLDLQRRCYESNDPVASVALITLYNNIRADCGVGVQVEMAAINAEARQLGAGLVTR